MRYGFENNQFYVELDSCRYQPSDYRTELGRALQTIYKKNPKIAISMSGGIDSQILAVTLKEHSIPFESYFFYMPGHNDNERDNLQHIEKKFGIKVHILTANPLDIRKEIDRVAFELDVHPNHSLHRYFFAQIPEDYEILQQAVWTPDICTDGATMYLYYSYHGAHIAKQRAVESLGRSGGYHNFNELPELFLSYLNDPISRAFITSWPYFKHNGLQRKGSPVSLDWAFDYYVKPLMYANLWPDELIFFPKYQGIEKLTFWHKLYAKEKVVTIAYFDYIKFLEHKFQTKRFYQLPEPLYKIAPWI